MSEQHWNIDFNICPINQKYFVSKGKMILSNRYRQSKAALIDLFLTGNPIEKPYAVRIVASQYADIDAFQKTIFDALTIAKIIEDDRFILSLSYVKNPIKRNETDEIDLYIWHKDEK